MDTMTTERRRIRVLSALVANQIAAGEVVERPASVVKELVENSLDAGARRIEVELEQGGVELVRVGDDGGGIEPDDLRLALSPHATSKIASADELARVGTLGFRGEALASIASVSRLTMRSRRPADAGASEIECEGETIRPARPAAGPVGTVVSVRNLFFNTPARRKFLRTPQTEQDRCVEVVRNLAIAHPAAGFLVRCDGRGVLDVPPGQEPRERAVALLGKELSSQMLEVGADEFDDARGLTLWGLVGMPSVARATNKSQHLFVNGRAVRDRTMQHALGEAFRGLIEPGRYPTAVLLVEMSPEGVDVNVHPAKAEVRFRDSSLVHSVVLRAVRRALQAADLTPTVFSLRPTFPGAGGLPGAAAMPAPADPATASTPGDGFQAGVERFVEYFRRPTPAGPEPLVYAEMKATLREGAAATPPAAPIPEPLPAARVLQVHKSYLVTQDEQGVVIIDQHALHERVMFEYLLSRVMAGGLETQRLLAPVVVEASPRRLEALNELRPLLERIGVSAEAMGPRTIGVHGFPTFLFDRGVDPVEFLNDLFERAESDAFLADAKRAGENALRDVLDMMACKAAVKAGDRLSTGELEELVKLRGDVERSSNCPHGRPTSVRLTIRELEKLFGRA